ncbi:MAG: hypothetical protein LC797_10490 [Chloroflexi bacterium]|nr:hypothetical protein [Chloroflexota bacterium]
MTLETVLLLLSAWVLGSLPLGLLIGRGLRVLSKDDRNLRLPSPTAWRTVGKGLATARAGGSGS